MENWDSSIFQFRSVGPFGIRQIRFHFPTLFTTFWLFFSREALVESGIYHVLGLFESSWIILLKEKKDSGRAFCDEFSSLLFITSLYGIDDGRPCNETYAAGLDNGDARCNEMYARFGLIIVMVERWIMAHGNVELWKIVLLPDCDA